MYTLRVTLRQHTPLIHFQHDQDGATLRASEVKPKLDRFILSKLTDIQKQDGEKNGWIKIADNGATLDCKLRITVSGEEKPIEFLVASYLNNDKSQALRDNDINVICNAPFFAQEKENRQVCIQNGLDKMHRKWNAISKKGILYNEPIDMILFSRHAELITIIQTYVQAFFLCFNFGTRQSKGFGGFTVESILNNDGLVPLGSNEELLCGNFAFVYRKQIPANAESPFPLINQDYQLLKSGRRKPYARSLLMRYEYSKHIRWEKKYIKEDYNRAPFKAPKGDYYHLLHEKRKDRYGYSENERFIRAILGLAEQYEFLLEEPYTRSNKLIVKISNKEIERYQSPLLFKVIDNRIYIVGKEVNPGILGKTFKFDLSIKDDDTLSRSIGLLDTPKDFSLKDFMRFAMNQPEMADNYIPIKQ